MTHQHQKPITDRRPTAADADQWGHVLCLVDSDGWLVYGWDMAAAGDHPWLPTPSWVDRTCKAMEEVAWLERYIGPAFTDPVAGHFESLRKAIEELAK